MQIDAASVAALQQQSFAVPHCAIRCARGVLAAASTALTAKNGFYKFGQETKTAPHTCTHPSIGPGIHSASSLKPERESTRALRPEFTLTRRRIAAPGLHAFISIAATRSHAGVGPRAQHGQPYDGACTAAEAPPARPPSEAEARGAARFNSRTRHLRAGRLAAPVAQTRRGAHDGDETKSCRVFE